MGPYLFLYVRTYIHTVSFICNVLTKNGSPYVLLVYNAVEYGAPVYVGSLW